MAIACNTYNNLEAKELARPELNSAFNILTRIAYEQFQYQESFFEEMARPQLFFDDYSGRKTLEVINKDSLAELIGAPLNIAIGVAMLLHTSACKNAGIFDPATIASVREIEHLIAVGQRVPAQNVLSRILEGEERRDWDFGVALNDLYGNSDRNPLLDEAWNRLPFTQE